MKHFGFKIAKLTYDKGLEADNKALLVIHDLGLKEGQLVSETELFQLVKAIYGQDSEVVLSDLFERVYFKPFYVINLKAKRDDADLLTYAHDSIKWLTSLKTLKWKKQEKSPRKNRISWLFLLLPTDWNSPLKF